MSAWTIATETSARLAVASAMHALGTALRPDEGAITPATETQVQNAIDLLRKTGEEPDLRVRLEQIAADLRIMANSKRNGRPNLYASRLARLRRSLLH
jgi:hypothetical protein